MTTNDKLSKEWGYLTHDNLSQKKNKNRKKKKKKKKKK